MRRQIGFTLIELMIVVVVIGILATIVYPSYREHIVRGKLAEAFSGLAQMRMQAEQYFGDNRSYVGFPCTSPIQATYFQFACSPATTASTYRIVATGISSQGVGSFVYTINQTNTRTSDTPWGDSATCWVVKSDGSC